MTENLYEMLGVSPKARPEVIRAAYQALAKVYHPDAGSSPDEERMKQLNEAWETLGDPDRRARHDADLRRTANTTAGRAATDTNGSAEAEGPTEPAMGKSGWGEGAEKSQPRRSATSRPSQPPRASPPPRAPRTSAPPPPRAPSPFPPPPAGRSFGSRPTAPPPPVVAVTDPTAMVVDRRLGAAVVDVIVVAVVALISWQIFVVSTYDLVGPTSEDSATAGCSALGGMVRDCEEIDGNIYVSDETSSLIVEWLTWLVPIVLVHVLLQARTGATIGKLVFGIRTIRKNGELPSTGQTLARTALAVVDMLPWCFPVVGLCLVLTTRGHQRLGDMAAKTFVVAKSDAGKPIPLPSDRH